MKEIKLSYITGHDQEYTLIYRGNENIIIEGNIGFEPDAEIEFKIKINRFILEKFMEILES